MNEHFARISLIFALSRIQNLPSDFFNTFLRQLIEPTSKKHAVLTADAHGTSENHLPSLPKISKCV